MMMDRNPQVLPNHYYLINILLCLIFSRDLMRKKNSESKAIRETIQQLNVTMKALVNNCDELTK